MSDLLKEIMDDVHADRMGDAWSKHGKWVIYLAVSIVLVTAAVVYWNHHKRETAMNNTSQYFTAAELLAKGEASAAYALFDKMSLPQNSTYYSLVLLKKAEALSLQGKHDEAKKLYGELADRNDLYGDVGKIFMKQAMTPESKNDNALQFSRLEWAAWDSAAKKDNAKAAEQFAVLAKMESAPSTLRDRAAMMANYLKTKNGSTAHE